jgi:hypothetical protein
MFSASEGVRPDIREFGVSGRPVGKRKRRLGVPAWTSGVDGRTVLSYRPANMGSGRVRFDDGLKEEPKCAPSEWVTSHFRGLSRPRDIIFVELLLPRRSPSNSSSREFRPLGTCPTTWGRPLSVAACLHCFDFPGEKEASILLF